MIGYNFERFANSTANLEHVSLYFDNLVEKNGTLSAIVNDFPWDFFTPLWIHARPSERIMVIFKLKLVCPEKKIRVYDAQTCKNANPDVAM